MTVAYDAPSEDSHDGIIRSRWLRRARDQPNACAKRYAVLVTNYLATLKGKLVPTGQGEDFVHTFGVVSSSGATALAADIAAVWDEAWAGPAGTIGNAFSAQVTYTEVQVAQILNLSDPAVMAATHHSFVPPLAGSNLTTMIPTQLAVATSWIAGTRANGTPLRGRTYLPTPALDTIDTVTGHLKVQYQTELGTGMQGFVQGLFQRGHGVSVWSRKEGRLAQVTAVRMGNIVDTIRSRRNTQDETYQEYPIVIQ